MSRTLRKVLELRLLGEVYNSGEGGRMSIGVPDTGNSRYYRKLQSTKELCGKEIQEVSVVAGTKQIREEAQDEQRHKTQQPEWVELWKRTWISPYV